MIEYERKFAISEELASRLVDLESYDDMGLTTPYIAQDDIFPFGVFKNGFMVRLRVQCGREEPAASFLTIKWWDLARRRVEHEFALPVDFTFKLFDFLSKCGSRVLKKARISLDGGVFLDYVHDLGYFIEMEKVLPASSVATKEQREAIDQEFKAKFKELTGMEGNFADFSYSQRLFGKE